MKQKRDKIELNILRLMNLGIIQIEKVEYYLKCEGMENRKAYSKDRFLEMLKSSCYPFEGGLSYLVFPHRSGYKLRLDGGEEDTTSPSNIVAWFFIKNGYYKGKIENELNKAMIIDFVTRIN